MKKISADFRKGYAKVQVENPDDLWYLSQVIEEGDYISGMTFRKISMGSEERKTKTEKKPMFIKIKAEKVEFSESSTMLRVLGIIEEGPEDIPRGEHHTFNIEEGTQVKIEKGWLSYQIARLEEAFLTKPSNVIIVVFDREEAYFALMKKYGYEILSHIEGTVAKKGIEHGKLANFYEQIISTISEYDKRYNAEHIIVGSPAFWKDEFVKNLNDEGLKKKIVLATCSSVNKTAINEILKRDEVRKVLADDRTTKEINLVESLMFEISKNGKSSYGLKEVVEKANEGAVEILIITSTMIQKYRSIQKFVQLENLMKNVERQKGKVHIISSEHEGGKKLEGLGGIGAILRYKAY